MRLVIVGRSCPEIAAAASIAAATGAEVRHHESFATVIEQLRAGHGADLLLIDAGDAIAAALERLARERIFLPVVAYGIHCPPPSRPAHAISCRCRPSRS